MEFKTSVNLEVGPGRTSRQLKGFAYWMSVPWAIIATVICVAMGMPNGGRGGGYFFLGLMIVPTALLALVAGLFPSSRRVLCSCGWKKDFPARAAKSEEAQQAAP